MRVRPLLVLFAAVWSGQAAEEEWRVYTEHPRLLVRPQRLKLLRRERERQSPRWQQFETLVRGGAAMPEPGFAHALHYITSGDESSAKKAIAWATGPTADIRQTAIVYDWCYPVLAEPQKSAILKRLRAAGGIRVNNVQNARDKAFATLAIAGDADEASVSSALNDVINVWWRKSVAPNLVAGKATFEHADIYPLAELLHAFRDNLQVEMREDALRYFRDLPTRRLLSYYPARYSAAENEYRIPFLDGRSEPNLQIAALSRVAEMALVAYDNNARPSQYLQGWLMHDDFVLRSAFGTPYEFLWANPYQPGLTYEHMPLVYHDWRSGELFARSSWAEDASWLGVRAGKTQVFADGQIQPGGLKQPLTIGSTALVPASRKNVIVDQVTDGPSDWLVIGLTPGALYEAVTDDDIYILERAGSGGVLNLDLPDKGERRVEIRPASSN